MRADRFAFDQSAGNELGFALFVLRQGGDGGSGDGVEILHEASLWRSLEGADTFELMADERDVSAGSTAEDVSVGEATASVR